jgi:hypothetical protein
MKDFKVLLKVTLWSAGLLVALLLGMGSAYVVGSGVWFGARLAARMRARARLEG